MLVMKKPKGGTRQFPENHVDSGPISVVGVVCGVLKTHSGALWANSGCCPQTIRCHVCSFCFPVLLPFYFVFRFVSCVSYQVLSFLNATLNCCFMISYQTFYNRSVHFSKPHF